MGEWENGRMGEWENNGINEGLKLKKDHNADN